jgi:hypothetical protein
MPPTIKTKKTKKTLIFQPFPERKKMPTIARNLAKYATQQTARKASANAINEMGKIEIKEFFAKIRQFESEEQLKNAINQGYSVLPKRFAMLEGILSTEEKLKLIKLLNKYFTTGKEKIKEKLEALKKATKIIDKARTRAIE